MPASLRLYRARVTDTVDPQQAGRLKVLLPPSGRPAARALELWVGVAGSPLAPGFDLRPGYAVGDEVVVAAERLPSATALVVGSVRAPAGVPASGTLQLSLPGGQTLRLAADAGGTELTSGSGAVVHFEPNGAVTVQAPSVTVRAERVGLEASMVDVASGMSRFSGVVKCDTLIANAVVSASYTPGAGNLA